MGHPKGAAFARVGCASAISLALLATSLVCTRPAPQGAATPATQPTSQPASPAVADAPHVDAALRRAVAFLYKKGEKKQADRVHWESADSPSTGDPDWGRASALALRALVEAGERRDPRVNLAARFLAAASPPSIRARALRLHALDLLARDLSAVPRGMIASEVNTRVADARSNGAGGAWHVRGAYDDHASLDASAAVADALYAVARDVNDTGHVDFEYWKGAASAWRLILGRRENGLALLAPDDPAGGEVAQLANALRVVSMAEELTTLPDTICVPAKSDPQDDDALARLDTAYATLSASPNPGEARLALADLLLARGQKRIAGVDWFQQNTRALLATQRPDGAWAADDKNAVPDTALAILFLLHARGPVAINKLEYTFEARGDRASYNFWNQRPRDVETVVDWLSRQLERRLNWQTVGFDQAADWRDAPILFIAGSNALSFSPEHEQQLKRYVEQGGLIVGHADCNDARFIGSFQKLGQKLFAHEFRALDADHPVYTTHFHRALWGGNLPVVRGLSDGVRELMLLLPADQSKDWHPQLLRTSRGMASAQLMGNILLYANDKKFKPREDSFDPAAPSPEELARIADVTRRAATAAPTCAPAIVKDTRPTLTTPFASAPAFVVDFPKSAPAKPAGPSKVVTLARVVLPPADTGPEPLFKLRDAMAVHDVGLWVDVVALGQFRLQRYDVAWADAALLPELSAVQRLEVKRFLDLGGTLIVAAAPGAEGRASAERQFAALMSDPKFAFADPAPAPAGGAAIAHRVAQIADRPAVFIASQGPDADALAERLLQPHLKAMAPPESPPRAQLPPDPRSVVHSPALALVDVAKVEAVPPRALKDGEVDAAIKATRDDLLQSQRIGGNWEPRGPDEPSYGLTTAWAVRALLEAGEPPRSLATQINFLTALNPRNTDVLAAIAHVNALLAPERRDARVQPPLRKNATLLLNTVSESTGLHGGRILPEASDEITPHDTALAVGGLFTLNRAANLEVPAAYWKRIDTATRHAAKEGWSDVNGSGLAPTLYPTIAGLKTLLACRDATGAINDARCGDEPADPAIGAAMAQVVATLDRDPGLRFPLKLRGYHTFVALGEAMDLAGDPKYLGKTDWFRLGAAAMIYPGRPDSLRELNSSRDDRYLIDGLRLSFLARHRAKPWLTKLTYRPARLPGQPPVAADSNVRPSDVHNLTLRLAADLNANLRSQTIDLDADDDLADSPVAYLAGSRELRLSDAQQKKLKAFLDRGGLLVAHADCNSLPFANSVRHLGKQFYPNLNWAPLTPKHRLFTQPSAPQNGADFAGVSTLSDADHDHILLIPTGDPALLWQRHQFSPNTLDWLDLMRAVYQLTAK